MRKKGKEGRKERKNFLRGHMITEKTEEKISTAFSLRRSVCTPPLMFHCTYTRMVSAFKKKRKAEEKRKGSVTEWKDRDKRQREKNPAAVEFFLSSNTGEKQSSWNETHLNQLPASPLTCR